MAVQRYSQVLIFSLVSIISYFMLLPSIGNAKVLIQELPEPLVPHVPIEVNIEQGDVAITLHRVDYWDGYVVFVGTGRATDGSACISRTDFSLQLGNIQYEAASREQTRLNYGIDAPGTGFFTQCLSSSDEIVLLPFVAPVNQAEASIQYENRLYELPSSLEALQQDSDAPQPTSTFTPTPTRTPTPTSTVTFTPAPVGTLADESSSTYSLPLPSNANSLLRSGNVSNHGVTFTFERLDFWGKLPDNTRPNNDVFVVLTGTLSRLTDGSSSHCVGADDVVLYIGQNVYEMDDMRSANQFYQSDFPGYLLPQCVSGNSPATTFFVFDVNLTDGDTYLSFHRALLELDESMVDLASGASVVLATTDNAVSLETDDGNSSRRPKHLRQHLHITLPKRR